LLSAADVALFHAKASGRKQLGLFSPALLQAASERFRIEQGLRRAIDGGEFELFFQPEVAFATFTTNVLEALLRWRTSRGTYVAPGEFLAVAEQSGLILEIGDWVLTRAIQRTGAWSRAGRTDVRVAINVSARQLLQPGFVTRVKELLEAERLPASCIELELTENVLQTDSATVGVLRTLRSEGIAVALDDFGTGYSSLASLEQLPLTRVKLDRSLIAGIHTSSRSLSIAQSIIDLCRKLGLEITAEGVEYREQLSLLIPERTVHIQGFLVSRPVPEAEVPRLIEGLPARMRALLSEDPIRAAISNAPSGPEKSYRPTVSRTRSGKGRK
jgi:EAL domain-containing protein (putative c-di-GMP-specific phosphodiesterase class I)